jgi:hypothetical protein
MSRTTAEQNPGPGISRKYDHDHHDGKVQALARTVAYI